MKAMKCLMPAVLVLALGGCASAAKTVKAPDSELAVARGQPLIVVTHEKPSFSAMTANKVAMGSLFGAVGGAIAGASMSSAGDEIVATHGIEDPAKTISARLANHYAARLQPASIQHIGGPAPDEAEELAAFVGGKGVVADVKTVGWMFGYFPSSWGRYRVMYNARVRLIDASSGRVIGQVPCNFVSDEDSSLAPDYDQLLYNGAVLLKSKLNTAAMHCGTTFEAEMFEGPILVTSPAAIPVVATAAPPLAPVPPARAAALPTAPASPQVATLLPATEVAVATVPARPTVAAPAVLAPASTSAPAPVVPAQALLVADAAVRAQPRRQADAGQILPARLAVKASHRLSNGEGRWWYVQHEQTRGWVEETAFDPASLPR